MTVDHLLPEPGDSPVRMLVNGLETQARVDQRLIERTLLPALAEVAMRPRPTRRSFAFLVGPPGVGKSTLAVAVANAARHWKPELVELDAVGIDGFHYTNSYLSTHHLRTDASLQPLSAIKGAPETFDVTSLAQHLETSSHQDVVWPQYDRRTHDVIPGTEAVSAGLVLLEGNWLLLDEPGWRELVAYAAFVIYLAADPAMLRERLIERKILGGHSRSEAAEFYERSDRLNVERVIASSDLSKVDLTLNVQDDGTIKLGDPQ